MKKLLIIAATLAASSSWASQVYVCTDKSGKKSFQQTPCAETHHAEVKTYDTGLIGTEMPAVDIEQGIKDRDLRKLDRDIRASEKRIADYQQSMNSELNILRSKKRHASNNLAGAQWEDSISSEMNAVTARWDSMIRTEQSRLENLRNQRNNQ